MERSKEKTLVVVILGLLSFLYILNPGWGIFELLPDNLPVVGHLDETTANWILLSALAYFGIDLRMFVNKDQKNFQISKRL